MIFPFLTISSYQATFPILLKYSEYFSRFILAATELFLAVLQFSNEINYSIYSECCISLFSVSNDVDLIQEELYFMRKL